MLNVSRKLHLLFSVIWTSNVSSYYAPLPGKHAALTDVAEDQCVLPQAEVTASSAVEITDILQDSNYSSCLRLADRTGPRLHIIIPVFPDRLILDVLLFGHSLNCSPLAGMMISNIHNCDNGGCTVAVCISRDLFVSGTYSGCRYRCHCIEGCHAIVIDVSKFTDTTKQREICEIMIWTYKTHDLLGICV